MHVFRGLPSPLQRRPSAVAIGNFDGVHLGHQALLEYVKEAAQARGLVPSVVTFEPHPKDFFGRGGEVARISTLYDKVNAILGTGIERIYILPFNSRLACMPAETFVRDVLLKGLDACWMSVGKDFRFGGDRAGSVELLEELSRTLPYELYVSPTFYHKEARVSSSRIREALAVGDLYEAALMLGRPYSMTGRVIHGAALGRTLGFPTINQIYPTGFAEPKYGIYITRVKVNGQWYAGATGFGTRPTVNTTGQGATCETFIPDFSGQLYGEEPELEFYEYIAPSRKFDTLEELTACVNDAAAKAKAYFAARG